MTVQEAERLKLHNSLTEKLGEDTANRLMDSLPPFSWREAATKDDLKNLKEWAESRFDAQDARVAAEFVSVRAEISSVESRLSQQISQLAEKTAEKFAEQSQQMVAQTRTLIFAFAGFAATVCGSVAGGVIFA